MNNTSFIPSVSFSRPVASNFMKQILYCVLALIGMIILTLIVFVGNDLIYHSKTENDFPVSGSDFPRLSKNLSERVQLALNNENADTLSGLAMYFDDKLNENQSSNPASNSVNNQTIVRSVVPQTASRTTVPMTSYSSVPQPVGNSPTMVQNSTTLPVDTETAQTRLERRQNSVRRGGTVEPMSEIYDIEDVEPIGVVGDSRKREVLFYSPTTKQTFSAPLGARFRNGTLDGAEIKDNVVDGINFKRDADGQKLTRAWGKKPSTKKNNSVEQPLLTDEPVMTPTRRNPQSAKRQQ